MNKAVVIIAKICEVFHWVGCGFMIAISAALLFGKESLIPLLSDIDSSTSDIDLYGFSVEGYGGAPLTFGALLLVTITGIIVLALAAMVFRNIYLVFKTSMGKTKFSEGVTPFQAANVRMIKEIGIFCISIPIVQLIASIIAGLALGNIETSVQFGTLFFGLIILCLSRFFSYGMELQKDTEGLV